MTSRYNWNLSLLFLLQQPVSEFKCEVPGLSLPLSPYLSLFSPLFATHPNRSRQMAAHTESGSAGCFFQLMKEFFLSTAAKVLLIVGTVGFSIHFKVLTLLCYDLAHKIELNWIPFYYNSFLEWMICEVCLQGISSNWTNSHRNTGQ